MLLQPHLLKYKNRGKLILCVQLSSIVLVGYFVTAHCILTPILFKYHYTIRRRTYVLYKRKKQTQFY